VTATAVLRSEARREASLVEGEFPFTTGDFARIKALLHEDSGIHLPETKATLVYSRLAKRLRRLGVGSFDAYCDMVSGPEGAEERRAMLAALTTNVTRFFREPHHFQHLARLLPHWARQARAGARIRLWSAGCSTGQEPYSIAMAVLSALPEAASLDVRILATDIDPNVIAAARSGFYPDGSLEDVPPEARRNWLKPVDGGWQVDDAARALITFNELNLMSAWPIRARYQAVFCRNVAIYFEAATQDRLWERFGDVLAPEGRLYVGHSERVNSARFSSDGLTVYRLKGGAS
jgi:chemotaxis protein methyltransferase CheR